MSAAYKSLESIDRMEDDSESVSSNASSATIGRSSESPILATSAPDSINSRVLMLTSRGVSHRYVMHVLPL